MWHRANLRITLAQFMVLIAILAIEMAWFSWPIGLGAGLLTVIVALVIRLTPRRLWPLTIPVTLVSAGCLLTPLFSAALWIGSRTVTITVHVKDANTSQPLPQVLVQLSNHWSGGSAAPTTTGPDGRAQLTDSFKATGRRSMFEDVGLVYFGDAWFEASASRFHTLRMPLAEVTGLGRDIHNPTPPPIPVTLRPMPADTTGPFAALVGDYFAGDLEQGVSLSVEPDGRFEAIARYIGRRPAAKQGIAKIKDGRILLSILRQDNALDLPGLGSDLVVVNWSGRVYLIPSRSLPQFCYHVKDGTEPRSEAFGGYFLREGDWNKPVKGTPALPSTWQDILDNRRLHGRITALISMSEEAGETEAARVQVNLGLEQGVQLGTVLWVPALWSKATVVEVSRAHCTAELSKPNSSSEGVIIGSEVMEVPRSGLNDVP